MPNTTSFLKLLCLQRPCWDTITIFFHQHHHGYLHGRNLTVPPWSWKDMGVYVMLFFHDAPTFPSYLLPSLLLFLFLFSTSILLPKFLWSFYTKTTSERNFQIDDTYSATETDPDLFYISDDCSGNEDLVADVVLAGEALFFLSSTKDKEGEEEDTLLVEQGKDASEQYYSSDVKDVHISESSSNDSTGEEELALEKPQVEYIDIPICDMSTPSDHFHTPHTSVDDYHVNDCDGASTDHEKEFNVEEPCDENPKGEKKYTSEEDDDESSLVRRKSFQQPPQKIQEGEECFADTSTAGSTSKSSCEWRASANFRDSETDGFFSSSSRRSSANWESYTVYRKYDEEMMHLDRISTQKLRETESFRSIRVQPRSLSERITSKLTMKNKPKYRKRFVNPYYELEAAYVAQICLAWEALSWNYKNFQKATSDKRKEDVGCPARVAQQFQQFQVLLQRYIENEPYEYGRRPEIYARMRLCSPKLLQVPEFQGSEADEVKEDVFSRIPSSEFLKIMEDVIRTFMNFLKADREKHWQVFRSLFTKSKSSSVDPALLNLLRKANHKKKSRLKDLSRSRKCLRKRKLNGQDEMEILMGLIDMKIVSRVLRMPEINEEQVHWCEEKMSKVTFWSGRVERDSSPLFFPAQ